MEDLEKIRQEILKCKKCDLHKTKTNYVPGSGDPRARLVFVGEAPGKEEDLQGEPFVGSAGKLLTEMIESIGLKRSDVFICNVLKCRPPNNRDPTENEIRACGDYLRRQLEAIRPDLIVCLGRFAANFVFNLFGLKFTSITKVRGREFKVNRWGKEVKIFPIYHPAAILYRPQLREEYEEEFRRIKEMLGIKRGSTLLDFI
ncbi:uracil-DNA glycosylase [Archaeoglobales archaeon ex4484_92]|nr:MAG: uracil-DNA glycosylase [Archaeoglobales archaeon ex4484_92]